MWNDIDCGHQMVNLKPMTVKWNENAISNGQITKSHLILNSVEFEKFWIFSTNSDLDFGKSDLDGEPEMIESEVEQKRIKKLLSD